MKLYDIKATIGQYEYAGEKRYSRITVGSVQKTDKGTFIMLSRSFNPAGCMHREGSDSIVLSLDKPQEKEAGSQNAAPSVPPFQNQGQQKAKAPGAWPEIPF